MASQSVSQQGSGSAVRFNLKTGVLIVVAVILLAAFSVWSGVPQGEKAGPFWVGIAVLIVITFGLGWATWYLLFKPLPAGQQVSAQSLRAGYRQATALLLGAGSMGIVIGAFWDEVWHRIYGIPFGEDLLWRPHLLMYFGFGSVTVLGFVALFMLNRHGRGTFQQRFRANPLIGLLILLGAFLMYVLPADPIWHSIYGTDITAWGIPHLILVVNWITMILLAITIYMTLLPAREWGSPLRLTLHDGFPIVMFAVMLLMSNQFLTTEWDARSDLVEPRPEWLLAAGIVVSAVLVGVMANHTLRRFGAGLLVGIVSLLARSALIALFNIDFLYTNAWILALPILLAVDAWYAYRLFAKQAPSWLGAGIAGALGMAVVLFALYPQIYPTFLVSNIPVTLLFVLLASLGAS